MHARAVVGLLLGVILSACRPEVPPPLECLTAAQCREGQVCQANYCVNADAGMVNAPDASAGGDAAATDGALPDGSPARIDAEVSDGPMADSTAATDDGGSDGGVVLDGAAADVGTDSGVPPPRLNSDRFMLNEESSADLDVLANDFTAGLTVRAVQQVRGGTAQPSLDRLGVTYTATACAAMTGGFKYDAEAPNGAVASATVAVAIADMAAPDAVRSTTVAPSATPDRVRLQVAAPGENGVGSLCRVAAYEVRTSTNVSLAGAAPRVILNPGAVTPGGTDELEVDMTWGQQHYLQLVALDERMVAGPELPSVLAVDLRRVSSLTPPGSSVAFGGVATGDSVSRSWTLRNTSALVPLTLTSVALSGAGVSHYTVTSAAIAPGGEQLAPGGSRTISVTYTPTVLGSHAASLAIQTDGSVPTARYTVALTGTGVPAVAPVNDSFTVEEESLTVLDVLANDSPNAGLTISALGTPSVGVAGGAQSDTRVSYEATSCAVGTDSFSYTARDARARTGVGTINVTIADTRAPAQINSLTPEYVGTNNNVRLRFTAPGENGAGSTCSPLRYTLRVAADAAMTSPTSTTLTTPLVPGSQESRTVTLAWGQQHYLQLTATDEGSRESTRQVTPFTVDLRRSVSVSPAGATTIGPISVRASTTRSFAVRNTSPLAGLRVTGASVSGSTAFSITAGAAGTGAGFLAPNATHGVDVRYAPTTAGPHTGTLTITHDGAGSPLTVPLTGTTFPNRAPIITDAYSSPRVVRAGTSVTLTVVVRDDDNSLPGYDDTTITIDTTAIAGGAAGLSMTRQAGTSTIVGTYTRTISTVGLAGGYSFPVRVVDSDGHEVWDTVTVSVYTGVAHTVGVGGTHASIQAAINAAVTGDGVIILPGTYSGAGNANLVIGAKDIVLSSQAGTTGTVIDCLGTGRAINVASTGQTLANVISGVTVRGCSADGAVRLFDTTSTLLDVRFDSMTGAALSTRDARSIVRGRRLQFTASPLSVVTSDQNFECEFCVVDSVAEFQATRVAHLSLRSARFWIGDPFASQSQQTSSDIRIFRPILSGQTANRITGAMRVSILGPSVGSGSITLAHVDDVVVDGVNFGFGELVLSSSALVSGGTVGVTVPGCRNVEVRDCASDIDVLVVNAATSNVLMTGCRSRWSVSVGADLANATVRGNVAQDYAVRLFGSLRDSIVSDSGAIGTVEVLGPGVVENVFLPSNSVFNDPNGLANNGNSISCILGNAERNRCESLVFELGPRGGFYLPGASPAVNYGVRSAVDAGLDSYTTQATGTLDSGAVDVGFHYRP